MAQAAPEPARRATTSVHPRSREGRPRRPPDWLIGQLPLAMREDEFLERFVRIFQQIGDTLLHQADTVDHLVDPSVAPIPMVRYLGRWIGVESIDDTLPDVDQRRMVRELGPVVQWRGTRHGLERLLGVLAAHPVEIADSGGIHREGDAPVRAHPHVDISVGAAALVTADDLAIILRQELPASVTFTLTVAGDQVYSDRPTEEAS